MENAIVERVAKRLGELKESSLRTGCKAPYSVLVDDQYYFVDLYASDDGEAIRLLSECCAECVKAVKESFFSAVPTNEEKERWNEMLYSFGGILFKYNEETDEFDELWIPDSNTLSEIGLVEMEIGEDEEKSVKLTLTEDEVFLLSDGLIKLIENANDAVTLVASSKSAVAAVKVYRDSLQALNTKILGGVK